MEILDRGPGLPDDIAEQIGKPIIINSDSGLGIGLLLTHATLDKFGGSVLSAAVASTASALLAGGDGLVAMDSSNGKKMLV